MGYRERIKRIKSNINLWMFGRFHKYEKCSICNSRWQNAVLGGMAQCKCGIISQDGLHFTVCPRCYNWFYDNETGYKKIIRGKEIIIIKD